MIQPGEIARLAHRLSLGDKTIEKDYVLTWTLLAIAESPLRNRLAFKGGTALKKVYVPDYRFSEDLDFTLLDNISNAELTAAVETLFAWLRREVNITLAVRRVEIHQTGNPAIYLNYGGPLGGDVSSRFFKTDFTRDEVLLFPLVEAPLHVPYSDCRSRNQTLRVYSPEEILAEKLCALLGRTEPRDLYDVHYILEHGLADARAVSHRVDEKMAHNKVDRSELEGVLTRKQETLRRLWEPRLQGQMPDLPHLDAVIRETNRWLRQAGLTGG
ncbi:MAG: nucleotidyl transferase AbiEii/AbiGii toxin family protein [Chloroflexi bacterium HGW-Chloroflexi-1]|nr:MAG: nucleotidyl transferase AbiEii/AbiGii toxin family protein [Chloroflexi bacterium HGW-Chloroflexi-1]